MPDEFARLLQMFDAHLELGGWAPTTRRSYRYQLVCFVVDHLVDVGRGLHDATGDDIRGYLQAIPANGSKRGDAMRALKAFYPWLASRGRPDDPTVGLKIPRAKLRPAPELDEDACRRLLAAAFRAEPRRGWAMMLNLATGARVSSLVAVRAQDVHLGPEPWIWFEVAKGSRPYALPLSRRGAIAASHLLDGGLDPLLGVGAARYRQWVHQAESMAGLDRVWPHLLRHTFATKVARSGDVEAWRRAMNHADLSQWPRYVGTNDERIRAAIA